MRRFKDVNPSAAVSAAISARDKTPSDPFIPRNLREMPPWKEQKKPPLNAEVQQKIPEPSIVRSNFTEASNNGPFKASEGPQEARTSVSDQLVQVCLIISFFDHQSYALQLMLHTKSHLSMSFCESFSSLGG